jgi:hypothetical protein
MRFGYGAFRFEEGEAALRGFRTVPTRNDKGFLEKITVTLDIDFEIMRDGQAAIKSRFDQIANAIRRDGRDVGFYHDSGARSAIFIVNSETASGVRISQYPSLESDDGADYANKGSVGFTAEYLPAAFGGNQNGGQGQITNYAESVSVRGTGGPRYSVDVVDRGRPQRFKLADYTPVTATQQGTITVVSKSPFYQTPNPPLWPGLEEVEQREFTDDLQPASDGAWQCTRNWSYRFISPGPITGFPRVRS